jgi:hypothetical protein
MLGDIDQAVVKIAPELDAVAYSPTGQGKSGGDHGGDCWRHVADKRYRRGCEETYAKS